MLTPLLAATTETATGCDQPLALVLQALRHDHVLLLDDLGFIRAASRPAAEWLGAHPDDLLGQSLGALLMPEDREAGLATQLLARTRERGAAEADLWIRKYNGTGAWAQIHLEADRTSAEAGPAGLALTLVPRHQVPAELDRLRALLRYTPAGLWMTNSAGHLLEFSPAFQRTSVGATAGDHWPAQLHFIHPDHREAARQARQQALAQRNSYRIEYLDHRGRRLIESAQPRLNSRGAFIGLVGSLAESPEMAVPADDGSFQFLARVSREVREQAHRILRALDLTAEGNPSLAALQADTIEASARALLGQVDHLATLCRQPQSRDQIVFDPQPLLRGVLEEAGALAHQHGRGVEAEVIGGLPPRLRGDVTMLRQLLRLMLEHAALVARPASGPIGFRLDSQSNPGGSISFCATVQFDGPALEPGLDEWLASGEGSPAAFGDGGIRLRLARQAAQALGGSLTVDAQRLEAGFDLQSAPVEEEPAAALTPFTEILLEGRHALLLAEDPLRGILLKRLQSAGIEVTAFDDPATARSWMDHGAGQALDLAFIQFSAPAFDGSEFARWIRQARPELPLLTVSLQGEPGQAKAARETGFQGYLTPPLAAGLVEDASRLALSWGVRGHALITRFSIDEERSALTQRR